jgi:hypothetical protein
MGVGHSKFWEDFVYHPGGDEYVPGTNKVHRLIPVPLGVRAVGFFDDEVEKLLEGLRAERQAKRRGPRPRGRPRKMRIPEESAVHEEN